MYHRSMCDLWAYTASTTTVSLRRRLAKKAQSFFVLWTLRWCRFTQKRLRRLSLHALPPSRLHSASVSCLVVAPESAPLLLLYIPLPPRHHHLQRQQRQQPPQTPPPFSLLSRLPPDGAISSLSSAETHSTRLSPLTLMRQRLTATASPATSPLKTPTAWALFVSKSQPSASSAGTRNSAHRSS